jgi:hypothetical protein
MASFWDPIDKQNSAVKTASGKKTGGFWDSIQTPQAQPVQQQQKNTPFSNVPAATDWTKAQPMSIVQPVVQPKQNPIISFGKGLIQDYTNPTPSALEAERQLGVGAKTNDFLSGLGQKAYDFVAKAMTRTATTLGGGLVKETIPDIIAVKKVAKMVENREIPIAPDILDQFQSLNKTAPQIVGEVAQAVLAVYAPGMFGGKLKAGEQIAKSVLQRDITSNLTKKIGTSIGGKLAKGAIQTLPLSTSFGVAQSMASGSKDPAEIAQIIGTNIAVMGVLGLVLDGTIPVSKAVYDRTMVVKNQLKTEFIAKGYTPAEAERMANSGGYVGKPQGNTPKEAQNTTKAVATPKIASVGQDLATEARKYASAEEFVNNELNKKYPLTTASLAGKSKVVYHETDPETAAMFGRAMVDKRGLNVATEEYLALGQKGKGAVVEFDTRGMEGVGIKKPATGFVGQKEYEIINSSDNPQNVKSITFKNSQFEKEVRPSLREQLIERGGFVRTELSGGKIKYERPFKPESQLTDIWNEANKKTADDVLAQEARKYKTAEEFVKAQTNVFHGTPEKGFKLEKGKPLFLTENFDEANTYAGYSYNTKPTGEVVEFYAKNGKSLDLNKTENVKKVFQEIYGSPELKKTYNQIPEEYKYLDDYGDVRYLEPRSSQTDFEDWMMMEYQSKPKIENGLKVRTGSYSFEKETQQIRKNLQDAFSIYGKPTRQSVYNRWEDLIKYAKQKGYDFIEHTTESPDTSILFPEKIALNPEKSLLTKSQLTDIWNQANKKTATGADKVKADQATAANRIPDGKDQEEKLAGSQPEKNIQLQTQQSEKKVYSLKKQYTETEKKSIIKKAVTATGDNSSIVKRVTNSINKVMTNMTEYFQNEQERVRQLVERKDVKVTDESDPYLKMTLYPGRVADKITKTKEKIKEIVQEMNKVKVSRKEISDYLVARHAPERNAAIGEKAAGISTADANEKLTAIAKSEKGSKIKELAEKVQEVNNQTLDLLEDSGVISDKLYETLRNKYKYHVPLNRIMETTEDVGGILSGKGFNVASTGIKRAKGSELEVDDIMTNVVVNYEQAVLRSEKNIVDQATLAFARKNKDILGDLLIPARPMAIGNDFKGKILMERTTDPTILQLFENGKPVWIKINDKNLAVALRGIGREKLGGLMNAVASFTRLYSGLQTRFNPEFALPNKIRDLQETATYLAAQNKVGFKGAAKMAARDTASVKDVVDYLRGADTKGAKLYREMKEAGGTTGGFGLSTREKVELNLQDLEKMAKSNVKKSAQKIIEYVDNWNTIFEDSTRLSVYKQALDSGVSKERAAAMAKEASINFNRMGKGGPVINSLWMFSNASIQGSTKMIRALKNPKVLGSVVATIGGATAAVNQYNDLSDPDWREKVPKWDRLNGLPVVLPSSDGKFKYVTIPVSWGIKPIKVMADYAYDAMSGEGFDGKKMANDTLVAIINAYNPAGGSDFVSSLVPTIADTPVEIARNTSWSGAKIKPDYDQNAPADIQYFSSLKETQTGKTAIGIAEGLQKNTGISISPADIKYAYDQYVGGAGRFVSKTANMISSIAGGKELPIDEYPMISRFYRERTSEEIGAGTGDSEEIKNLLQGQSRERFEIKMKAEDLFQDIKSTDDKNKKKELLSAAIKETPGIVEKMTEIAKDEAKGLNYHDRLIKQLGVENGERANYILGKIKQMATPDEKKQYLSDLKAKGLITSEVVKSIIEQAKK